MVYLLDTNAVSALMRGDARMASWLSSTGVDGRLAICTITRGEVLFGLERLAQGRRRLNSKTKPGSYSPYYRVSRSRRPLAICTPKSKLLNNAAACHSTRMTSG